MILFLLFLLLLLLLLLLLIATVRNFILNKAESLEQVNSKEVKPAKKAIKPSTQFSLKIRVTMRI